MPRLAANLSFLFAELPFLERFAAAAEAGFRGVEMLFPYAYEPAEIRDLLDAHELQPVLFNVSPGIWDKGERGLAAITGREAEFEAALTQAIGYAGKIGCRQLHVMAGLEAHGAQRATYVRNLRAAAAAVRGLGITLLVEPINTFDMPGYLISRTEDAAALIDEVGSDSVRLQLDLYHRHRMEGDAAGAIARFHPIVAHYQIAGPPDRGEPVPSELDVPALFAAIDATGFGGWVGCEYRPRANTLDGLSWREGLAV
ncbi:MAG: 2-oxo-tetronate isomerase [Hyphomicrobiaceae bacterium]